MPQPASQSSAIPPLPPGYSLDQSSQATPPLPPGYTLDSEKPPPAAGPHVDMQEMNLLDPSNAGHPSPGVAPAGKLTGLPGVDPHTPTVKEGFGDTMLVASGQLPLARPMQIARGVIGATLGAKVGASGARVLGGGKTAQDFGEMGGSVLGGGMGAKAPELLATRSGRSVGVLAKAFGKLPIVDKFIDAGKTLGELGDVWRKPPSNSGAPLPGAPAPEVLQARGLEQGARTPAEPAAGLGKIPVRGSIAEQFKEPGAPLPAKPSQAFFQGRGLAEGARSPVEPAAGLGRIPVRGAIAEQMKTPETTPAANQSAASPPPPPATPRGSVRQMMKSAQSSLESGLGAVKPQVVPGKPIYQRGGIAQRMNTAETPASQLAAESPELLEGHTPAESSWIKSYKYDPATREFEMHPKSGNAVRLGDVSPEDAQAFMTSESKGTAWQQMKRNPAVAKRVNGVWQPIKPAAR